MEQSAPHRRISAEVSYANDCDCLRAEARHTVHTVGAREDGLDGVSFDVNAAEFSTDDFRMYHFKVWCCLVCARHVVLCESSLRALGVTDNGLTDGVMRTALRHTRQHIAGGSLSKAAAARLDAMPLLARWRARDAARPEGALILRRRLRGV